MLLVKLNARFPKPNAIIACSPRFQSALSNPTPVQEVTETPPAYPTIEDVSFRGRQRKKRVIRAEEVQSVKTVEEKFIKINMPKYWGFKCNMYLEGSVFYNELPQVQYITKTHVIPEPGLPSYYNNLLSPEELDLLVKNVKNSIEEGIAFEHESRRWKQEQPEGILKSPKKAEDFLTNQISKQINRLMLTNLSSKFPHLMGVQTDIEPRVEAFWFCGGLEIPPDIKAWMERRPWMKEVLDEPLDLPIQYLGNPSLHLRHELPLREIMPMSECENPAMEVPVMKFDPRTMGHALKRRHVTSVCGFWPGDACEYGLMSYHKRGYLIMRPTGNTDELDALKTHAVMSNYGWLSSLAFNLGFSTFNEITYPLVNQMIITNGQWWSFSVYQLNTTLVNGFHCDQNPKRNVCWVTEPMKLFDKLENGKLMGFNDEVVKHLVQFYANKPEERVGVNMKPYLSHAEQRVADYEDEDKRIWLEKKYKHVISNRPRHRLMPEMYHWEWIYKFKFQTRPLDKKRTPWDYGENPFQRRLDEHRPAYVPKAQRTLDMKIRRSKHARDYYP